MSVPPVDRKEVSAEQPPRSSRFSKFLRLFIGRKPSFPEGEARSLKDHAVSQQFGILSFVKRLFGVRSEQPREAQNERIKTCAQGAIATSTSDSLEGAEGGKAVCPKTRSTLSKDICGPDGTKHGTEVAQPRCSRKDIIKSLQAAKKDAKKKAKTVIGPKNQALQRIIERCDKAIKTSEEMSRQGDYPASGDVRLLAEKKDPKDIFCCELTNCYGQVVRDKNEKVVGSFLRFGALTDKVQGLMRYTALKKVIEKMKELEELQRLGEAFEKIQEKKTEVEEAIGKEKKRLETLRQTLAKSGSLSKRQKELFEEALKVLGEEAIKIDLESGANPIEKAYEDRQFIIQQQAVQFLNIQVQLHGKEVEEGKLHLYQLSLLNPSKIDITQTGIVHSETDEIVDEAELFKELGSARLLLDAQEAPYVDAEGVYHLQKPDEMDVKEITIVPHFINVVPQARLNKKDLELYNEVNQETLKEMKTQLERLDDSDKKRSMLKKLEKSKKGIEDGKVHFSIAEDMAEIGRFLGWNLSINCHSGKDRTGVISYTEVVNILLDSLHLDKKARLKLKDYLISKMFDGISREIVRANGYLHLKINPLKVKLNSLQSKIMALWNTIGVGRESVREYFAKKKG